MMRFFFASYAPYIPCPPHAAKQRSTPSAGIIRYMDVRGFGYLPFFMKRKEDSFEYFFYDGRAQPIHMPRAKQ
jgi:hypothetical protein